MCILYCTDAMSVQSVCLSRQPYFGQRNQPDARLSLKWIDANGSLLQSQTPQARIDRRPTYLSLSLSPPLSLFLSHTLSLSLCGTKWSATPNKSTRYRAAAGINLSALGSSRILSLLLAGSKSNKQEDKWRARRKMGGEENKEEKTAGLPLPTSSVRWTDTHAKVREAQVKKSQRIIT